MPVRRRGGIGQMRKANENSELEFLVQNRRIEIRWNPDSGDTQCILKQTLWSPKSGFHRAQPAGLERLQINRPSEFSILIIGIAKSQQVRTALIRPIEPIE